MSVRGLPALAVTAILCVATHVEADKAKAEEHYKRGFTAYNLGKFADAIREFERAFEEEPDPEYLYALAGAHRLATNHERAAFYYRRYLGLVPDPPNKPEIDAWLVMLDKSVAEKAVADKAVADKAAADKAVADKAAADKAAADKTAGKLGNKRVRISIGVGLSIVYLRGVESDPRVPSPGARLAVSYFKRARGYTFDVGGQWQITTIPYDQELGMDRVKATAVFFSQLHVTGSVMRDVVGPVWARAGIGLGLANYGNLQDGNPITMNGGPDARAWCVRFDATVGYRYSPTIDFAVGLGSASGSARSREAPDLGRTITLEGGYIGVDIKL